MFTRMSELDTMFGAMDLLRNKMDRIFTDFDVSRLYGPSFTLTGNMPRTNLLDNGETFEIYAEVPGIRAEDLDIKIQGNYLEISGNRTVTAPEGYKVHKNERSGSSFSRSFTLPEDVDADKVDATLKDGILHLVLSKSEAARPRQITIN